MQKGRLLGGVLLVAGTTIGAGMLGLPVTTGFMGFGPSILLFILCWLFMLFTALFFVDVNTAMEGETNLITMAERTLGFSGRALSWVVYLLLLYSLMAAYMGGCAPLFIKAFDSMFGIVLPKSVAQFLLPLIFGPFIYLGTKGVDWLNRALMVGLIVAYVVLVLFLPSHIHFDYLSHVAWSPFVYAAPVVVTSFGYHIIIPSLATYLNHDRRSLKMVCIIGSLIALVVNLFWQFLVLGCVPLEGANGLGAAWLDGSPITAALGAVLGSSSITLAAYFFSFFAIITSFLGVSLSLSDFLTDGLHLKKTWEGRLLAILLSFVPPLIFVHTYQRGFLLALEYAGAFVAILLILLPAMMGWTLDRPFYKSMKGRALMGASMLFALFIVVVNILIRFGIFDNLFVR